MRVHADESKRTKSGIIAVMLKLSATLHNLPIMSLRSGGQIAVAIQPLINPHNLKILGWWCSSRLSSGHLVLLIDEVRETAGPNLVVNDNDSLSEPADLARHKEIIDAKFELIGKQVKTKRHKLGKVSDFSYNDDMYIQKLYVARPVIKLLSADSTLIIDRTQILEVTDDYILVNDAEVEEGVSELAPEPAA